MTDENLRIRGAKREVPLSEENMRVIKDINAKMPAVEREYREKDAGTRIDAQNDMTQYQESGPRLLKRPTYAHPIPRFLESILDKLLGRDTWARVRVEMPTSEKKYFSQSKPFEPEVPLHVGPWPHGGYHPPGPRIGPGPHNPYIPPERKENQKTLDELIQQNIAHFSHAPYAHQAPKKLPENYTLHARVRDLDTGKPVTVQQATGYQLFPG